MKGDYIKQLKETIEYLKLEMEREKKSHDAQILQIAIALGYEPGGIIPAPTVNDILKILSRYRVTVK